MSTTLGNNTRTIYVQANDYDLHVSFPANVAIPKGAIVKLNTDGTVEVADATDTDNVIGVCFTPADNVGDPAVILVKFTALVNAKSTAAIAVGDKVSSNKTKTEADGETAVQTAASGHLVTGVALEAATAADEYILVGMFNEHEVLA